MYIFTKEEEARLSKLKVEGYCIRRAEYSGEEIYILKKSGSDEKADLDFLRRVEDFLSGNEATNFYRELLLKGEDGISKADIKANSVKGAAGYFVVAVLTGDMNDDEREAAEGVLRNIYFEEGTCSVVSPEDGKIVAVCAYKNDEERKRLTELAKTIEDTLSEQIMVAAKVGIGGVQESLGKIKASFEQAVITAEMGKTQYDKLGMLKLFSKISEDDAETFVREVLGEEFFREKSHDELLETIEVFLDCNMNISEASKALFIHRNTLMYRIKKFKELTGLDATKFDDGVCIRTVCFTLKLQKKENRRI